MPAPKDLASIKRLFKNTELVGSSIWRTPVEQLTPFHFSTFETRMAINGQGALGHAIIAALLNALAREAAGGHIPEVSALSYSPPNHQYMTSLELRAGLLKMGRPASTAALFALESGLDPESAGFLTWATVRTIKPTLTHLAKHIIKFQPRHIRSPYVFWREGEKIAMPTVGLAQEVLEIFGQTWGEFEWAYRHLILVADYPEYEDLLARWQRISS